MKIICITLGLVCILLSGCIFPYRYTVAPPVSGIVFDEISKEPIPNAEVYITSQDEEGIFHREYITRTEEDGSFRIPAQKVTWIWIVPQEPYYPRATLTVNAKGYLQYQEEELGSPQSGRGKEACETGDYTYSYLSSLRIPLKRLESQKP